MINIIIYGLITVSCQQRDIKLDECNDIFIKCINQKIWEYEDIRTTEYNNRWDMDAFIECRDNFDKGELDV